MTLQGSKNQGTDLHSKTAKILEISRDAAKVFNYSRIYGAGQKHMEQLLLQVNTCGVSKEEASKKAKSLYSKTKGNRTRGDLWFGGTESVLFNSNATLILALDRIALNKCPETPALGGIIPDSLLPKNVKTNYMPSRINWAIQSSGVDYLHLLLISMKHLVQIMDIQARFMISIHDEIRFLVKEGDEYKAALAFNIANLWVRSFFSSRVNIDDLPLVRYLINYKIYVA